MKKIDTLAVREIIFFAVMLLTAMTLALLMSYATYNGYGIESTWCFDNCSYCTCGNVTGLL